jgi:hypothetical protein
MAWNPKTQASPQNIRKRIDAAIEALEGAITLANRRNDMSTSITASKNAIAWAKDARFKTLRKGGSK